MGVAVLNAADEHAELIDEVIAASVQRKWYAGVGRGQALRLTDLSVTATELSGGGTHIALAPSSAAEALGGSLHVNLVGDVFAENTVAAALALLSVGIDAGTIRQSFSDMPVVPGRFEVIHNAPFGGGGLCSHARRISSHLCNGAATCQWRACHRRLRRGRRTR
jgi:UDP-N-acetylmuramoyl-L-alanyl-D-glutamate--2,6-diaminopimelate ligase